MITTFVTIQEDDQLDGKTIKGKEREKKKKKLPPKTINDRRETSS